MPTYLCWDDEEERPEAPTELPAGSWQHAAEMYAELVMGDYDDEYPVAVQAAGSDQVRVYRVEREVTYRAVCAEEREKEPV